MSLRPRRLSMLRSLVFSSSSSPMCQPGCLALRQVAQYPNMISIFMVDDIIFVDRKYQVRNENSCVD